MVAAPSPGSNPRDVEQSVLDDIAVHLKSPFSPDEIPVTGFVYDAKTGKIHDVEVA